jgi:TPR repeat protein
MACRGGWWTGLVLWCAALGLCACSKRAEPSKPGEAAAGGAGQAATGDPSPPEGIQPGSVPKDSCVYRGVDACRSSCDGGDQDACGGLALLQMTGAKDAGARGQAAETARKACDAGSAMGCGVRAALSSRGSSDDPRKVRGWLEMACDADIAMFCVALGDMLEAPGAGADWKDAARDAFDKACKLGDKQACARVNK